MTMTHGIHFRVASPFTLNPNSPASETLGIDSVASFRSAWRRFASGSASAIDPGADRTADRTADRMVDRVDLSSDSGSFSDQRRQTLALTFDARAREIEELQDPERWDGMA